MNEGYPRGTTEILRLSCFLLVCMLSASRPPDRVALPPSPASSPTTAAASFPAPTWWRSTSPPATTFTHGDQQRGRRSRFPSLPTGTYTVTVTLQGFKTVVVNNVVLTSGAPAQREGDARSRRRHRAGDRRRRRRKSCRRSRPTVSTTINTNQITKLPLTQPQRDGLRQLPAGRVDAGRQPRRDDQRPAARHDQHHARRRQHPGQHAAHDRRLLRDRQPASRRDRRSHGHDRDAGRRQLPARAPCRSSS